MRRAAVVAAASAQADGASSRASSARAASSASSCSARRPAPRASAAPGRSGAAAAAAGDTRRQPLDVGDLLGRALARSCAPAGPRSRPTTMRSRSRATACASISSARSRRAADGSCRRRRRRAGRRQHQADGGHGGAQPAVEAAAGGRATPASGSGGRSRWRRADLVAPLERAPRHPHARLSMIVASTMPTKARPRPGPPARHPCAGRGYRHRAGTTAAGRRRRQPAVAVLQPDPRRLGVEPAGDAADLVGQVAAGADGRGAGRLGTEGQRQRSAASSAHVRTQHAVVHLGAAAAAGSASRTTPARRSASTRRWRAQRRRPAPRPGRGRRPPPRSARRGPGRPCGRRSGPSRASGSVGEAAHGAPPTARR